MKIIYVVHSFLPHTAAGTEVYTYKLAKELAKSHEVSVFFRVNDPRRKEYEVRSSGAENLNIYEINHTLRFCSSFEQTYRDSGIDEQFGKVLDQVKPDVVHIQHLLFLSLGIVDQIKARNIPIVYTLNDYCLICYRGQLIDNKFRNCLFPESGKCQDCLECVLSIRKHALLIYYVFKKFFPLFFLNLSKKLYSMIFKMSLSVRLNDFMKSHKAVCSKTNIFLAPSGFMRDKMVDYGFPKDKVMVSGYGFDTKQFIGLKKVKSKTLRFGYIGTLLPMKGLDSLVGAFKGIKNSSIELLIFGRLFAYSGFENYPAVLKKTAADDRRISLMGGYDNKDVEKILSGIDVLVVPSIWQENSPLVIREAFLSKTPVIAARTGGIPELIEDKVSGLLFEPDNMPDLREKMEYLMNNQHLLEEFSAKAPSVKTIEENGKELEKIYEHLINRG